MGAAPGIAGSTHPEVEGIFLCLQEFDLSFFVRMNNTGGPADVWAVDGIDAHDLVASGEGFWYLPARISREHLTLLAVDIEPVNPTAPPNNSAGTYQSNLVLTLADGTVLRDEAAQEFIMRGSAFGGTRQQ